MNTLDSLQTLCRYNRWMNDLLYAVCATLPNVGSVGLHEAIGFQPVGAYRNAGYKMSAWHSVGWWQLALQDLPVAPTPTLTIDRVKALPE